MQADAFLFETLVEPGDAVVVETPTYDRTLLNLRNRGADVRMVALETDGIDVAELEHAAARRGVRPTLAHIIPNFQNPAGYTLAEPSASALLRARRRVRLHDLRGRPVRRDPLQRRAAADDARRSDDDRRASSTRRRSPRRSARASASATWSARPSVIAEIQRSRPTPTSRRTWSPSRSSTSSARSGGIDALDRDGQGGAAPSASSALTAALERELPEARFQAPEGGYFMWVELPEGTEIDARLRARPPSAAWRSSRAPTSCSRAARTRCAWRTRASPTDQIDEGVARLAEAVRAARAPRSATRRHAAPTHRRVRPAALRARPSRGGAPAPAATIAWPRALRCRPSLLNTDGSVAAGCVAQPGVERALLHRHRAGDRHVRVEPRAHRRRDVAGRRARRR